MSSRTQGSPGQRSTSEASSPPRTALWTPCNEGLKHAEDIRAAIRLAGLLGVKEIVTMSGTPGTDPSARYPTWVVNPWNGIDMEILDYQWSVVVPFFKEIDALARDNDVQVCLELHPRNLVFNVPSFERLVEETGATHIKVNMDPSHLFWQQMDPIEATKRLGSLVGHVHAKDTRVFPGAAYRGVLDTDFGRVPAEAEGKVPVAYGYWCNSWPQDPAWRFVALGLGHDRSGDERQHRARGRRVRQRRGAPDLRTQPPGGRRPALSRTWWTSHRSPSMARPPSVLAVDGHTLVWTKFRPHPDSSHR